LSEGELPIFSSLNKMLNIDAAEGFMARKMKKGLTKIIWRAMRR